MTEDLKSALGWRYATKGFDSTRKVSDEDMTQLLETLRLAPVSFGLQTWQAVVVDDAAVRAELRSVAWDQPQVTDASHFIVLATKKNIGAAEVDAYISLIAETRGIDPAALAGFADMMKGSLRARTPEQAREWAARQAYIVLGFALEAAALMGIDTCALEGFDPAQFDRILGLDEIGLESRVALAVGYRSEADAMQHLAKVRLPLEQLVIRK